MVESVNSPNDYIYLIRGLTDTTGTGTTIGTSEDPMTFTDYDYVAISSR